MSNQNQDQHYYKWEPTDQFSFSGKDFSFIYNLLENITQTPQFQEKLYSARETMQVVSLHDILRAKLQENVTSGIVKEVNKEEHEDAVKKALEEVQKTQNVN